MNATRDWFYQLPPVDLGDRCLHVGPISHGSGYLFLPVWLGGGCNILYPRFDAQTSWRPCPPSRSVTSSRCPPWSPT